MLFGIDAGGTVTTAVVQHTTGRRYERTFPSISASAVGECSALDTLNSIFQWVSMHQEPIPSFGWVGSAAVSMPTLSPEAASIGDHAKRSGVRGVIGVSDDAALLLLGPPLNGVGFVAIAGTGSILIGRNRTGQLIQCGGYEYIISDEGSGFYIGRRGLQAAARAYYNTAPTTALLDLARQTYEADIPALGDSLARLPFPKQRVASFAKVVCGAAERGDRMALEIVREAAAELLSMLRTATRLLNDPPSAAVAGGSLPSKSEIYAGALLDGIAQWKLPVELVIAPSGADCALALARELADNGGLYRHVDGVPHLMIQIGEP
jgi:N-acetylglucosamine kinase-like BadF-type ATPase